MKERTKSETKKTRCDVDKFIEESIAKHGDKFSYEKTRETYLNRNEKCLIHCNIHNIDFLVRPFLHLKGDGCCPKCLSETRSKNNINSLENLIKRGQEKFGDKITYEKTEYKGQYVPTTFNCVKHGYFERKPKYFLKSSCGCHLCALEKTHNNRILDREEALARANEKHNFKYDYSKFIYKTMFTPSEIICHEKYSDGTEHGSFWQTPHNHIHGTGCPKCKVSKMEDTILKELKNDNINFIHEASKKDLPFLGKQRLDFYLPDYNIAIECQGKQHFIPVDFGSFGEKRAEKLLMENHERDLRKKKLCKENSIDLIYYIPEEYVLYMSDDDIFFTDDLKLFEYLKNNAFF